MRKPGISGWMASKLLRCALVGCLVLAAATGLSSGAARADDTEAAFWSRIPAEGDRLMLETYLLAFPNGPHADEARRRLDTSGQSGNDGKTYPPGDVGWIGFKSANIRLSEVGGYTGFAEMGTEVVKVAGFGPNAAGDLRAGDVIVAVDGQPSGKPEDFGKIVQPRKPGSRLVATVLRDGVERNVELSVGGMPTDIRPAAEGGNAFAQWFLALAYHSGLGVPKNPVEAYRWALKSAEGGDPSGQTYAAYYLLNGIGTAVDEKAAVSWFLKAANQFEPTALNWMGVAFEKGLGTLSANHDTAILYYRDAAVRGEEFATGSLERLKAKPYDLKEVARGLHRLGYAKESLLIYEGGPTTGPAWDDARAAVMAFQRASGVAVDGKFSLALARMVRRALDTRDAAEKAMSAAAPAPAATASGTAYLPGETGWVGIEIDTVRLDEVPGYTGLDTSGARILAVVPFGTAATSGLAPGDVIVAINGRASGDMVSVVRELSGSKPGTQVTVTAIRNGSQIDLALRIGGLFTDSRAAAEAGDPIAQMNVVRAYELGIGVLTDPAKAFEWALKAAEQGSVQGQFSLGFHYRKGLGVTRDDKAAVAWFTKAAEQNSPSALNWLGTMFEQGMGGLAANLTSAISLYRRAAARGETNAVVNLERLKTELFDVAEIVRGLRDLGFAEPGREFTNVDKRTGESWSPVRSAIARFQRSAGLRDDGELSLDLAKAIQNALSRKANDQRVAAATGKASGATAAALPKPPAAKPEETYGIKSLDSLD